MRDYKYSKVYLLKFIKAHIKSCTVNGNMAHEFSEALTLLDDWIKLEVKLDRANLAAKRNKKIVKIKGGEGNDND